VSVESAALRVRMARRGRVLAWTTLVYNALEGVIATTAGWLAGSTALVGFGVDSVIEVSASLAALWRLRSDADHHARERAERIAARIIGLSFAALAAYVAIEAVETMAGGTAPRRSVVGIVLAAVSLFVMPLLARAKRRVARALDSGALHAEARQTDICMILSAILLVGLGANLLFGWWWADPAAALVMAPLIAFEGWKTLRGRPVCSDCAPPGI